MSGVALPLKPHTWVLDCLAPLSAAEVKALQSVFPGCAFARYLDNLTSQEVASIHGSGAAILLLVEGRTDGLSAELGTGVGQAMASRAMGLQVPPSVSIVIDLEDEGPDPAGAIAYASACATLISRYAWRPGVYAGAPQTLSAAQLYALPVWPYWCGGSVGLGSREPACGWALVQLPPLDVTVAGHQVDVSASCVDAKGRTFTLWGPPAVSERDTLPELPDA